MEQQGKQGVIVSKVLPNQDPVKFVQFKYKELEDGFKSWLSKQSLLVEAFVVTATSGVQGAAIGAIMGTITPDISSSMPTPPQAALNPQAMASLKQAQYPACLTYSPHASCSSYLFFCLFHALAGGPLIQARNFAVMTGTNAGIACVMKRLRGKEDVQSSMVAAFGSGAMFSLVSGMGGSNNATNAITSGLFFALVQGGLFKLGEKFSQPPTEDLHYARTRSMLSNLGLQNYEKNFKKGLLTDHTLPLLTDSALRDVRIPPGPRLLILDHIQRDPELREKTGKL
ncbi:mitochondrial import inner membrane translocase Tim17/Tim22/Tim23 family protein [Salix suchowensis]|nr:mitochondrial import inner membrane translocase Tim17/Tim22/Tim23 family protein [Salix suchowensis]